MPDATDPADMPEIRATLRRAGIDDTNLTDEQAIDELTALLERTIPAPATPASDTPINARAWLADALTSGGFRQPEDERQRADLGDGGADIDLGVCGILIMRHLGQARPNGWDDEGLAEKTHQPVEDITRAQRLLDEVASDLGVEARPEPRWWLGGIHYGAIAAMAFFDLKDSEPVILVAVDVEEEDVVMRERLAAADEVPAPGYRALWGTFEYPEGYVAALHFEHDDGFERRFKSNTFTDELPRRISQQHLVIVMPVSEVEDYNSFDPVAMATTGAIVDGGLHPSIDKLL